MAKQKGSGRSATKTIVAGEGGTVAPRRYCDGALVIEAEQSYRVVATRGSPMPSSELAIADDRVVEIELDGGVVLYTSFAQLRKDFPTDAQARAAQGAPADAYIFPRVLPLGGEARGLSDWAVKAWNLLALRFDDEAMAAHAVRGLAWLVEHRIAARAGLHALALGDERALERLGRAGAPQPELGIDTAAPILLFIHGTGSSTAGSFEGLWSVQNRALREALAAQYQGNALAFEHATLSVGPIGNALDLARALPAGARLHLVTHSRGGLVGELLARGGRGGPGGLGAFDETDLALAGDADAALLKELARELAAKRLRVERFVRVACPARGTSLASGRLDRYLSVIINVLRLASLGGTAPVLAQLEDFTAFAAAVIERRKDAQDFPGLAAMMPDSPLVRLLNRPGIEVEGDLTVIAGDAEPQGVLQRLALLLADLYYDGEHDFIVDTDNMSGGAARAEQRIFRHQHGEVSHFRYFANAETSRRVVSGLLQADGFGAGFVPLRREAVAPAMRAMPRAPSGPAPVVFVLPGIMGSALGVAAGDAIDTVWMDFLDLARGSLCRKLPIPDKFRVVAEAPLPRTYGRLIDHLGATQRVVPFAYDWRISLRQETDRLAERLLAELERTERENQPVRILAHSMGGLLARALLAFRPEVWRRVCLHPDARVVMLGTPTRGSHSITRVLAGQESVVDLLAVLDLRNSKREILATIARYPGVLELLPDARAAGTDSLLDAGFWSSLPAEQRRAFALPEAPSLDAAREVRARIGAVRFEAGRLIYVAGKSDETPIDFAFGDDGLEFTATDQGDGRVPWGTGIPEDAATVYYLDAVHGDMADTPEAFDALLELLHSGATMRLSRQPPAAARGAPRMRKMKAPVVQGFPDEAALESAARGGARRRAVKARLPRVRVRVRHGELRYARHPVVVGHYFGDSIVSAENALDRMLDNRLGAHLQLGLYPGRRNTAEVFVNPQAGRPSAIVVGLGGVGELSVGALADCFSAGLLRYAALCAEGAFPAADGGRCGVSALLVGSGGGGLSVEDALTGLLRGMYRAAQTLATSDYAARVVIEELELIELYEDRAIATVRALRRLVDQVEFRDGFDAPLRLDAGKGGFRRAMFEEPANWWQRLQIAGSDDGGLRFVSLTQRARAEARLQPLQRPLVNRFLEQARDGTANDDGVGVTLFELLLPNELKELAPERSDLVLIVDDESARYPWELLRDRHSADGEPMVVQRGVLRQLQTFEYRANPDTCRNTRALVVGDPLSKFVALPGAQREAEAVAACLADGDGTTRFDVKAVVRAKADTILRELMSNDFQIVHLAGHGVFEYPLEIEPADGGPRVPPVVSGMVIGDDMFLTSTEVRQMRRVPELVFINCCHLGRVEPGSRRNDWFMPQRLAANLAVEFVRMGVRAVIAAGWEVDDEAGRCFAEVFYRRLLAGVAFGKAVQEARRETWQRHRQVNTWGAYQCYGDPDYRIGTVRSNGADDAREPFVASAEARVALHNLAAEIASADALQPEAYAPRIAEIEQRLGEELLADGGLRARLGGIYFDCRDFANALRCYAAADLGELTPLDLEHYANAAARRAEELADRPAPSRAAARRKAAAAEEPRVLLDRAIVLLEGLLCLQPSAERYALMGSAQKRLALLGDDDEERRAALVRSAYAYASAARLAEERGMLDGYALLNAWSTRIVLGWLGGTPAAEQPAMLSLDQALEQTEARAQTLARSEDFWERALAGDCALLRLIAGGERDGAAVGAVAAAYRNAAALGARPREWHSVLSQVGMLARFARLAGRDRLATHLESLRSRLGAAA